MFKELSYCNHIVLKTIWSAFHFFDMKFTASGLLVFIVRIQLSAEDL